MLLTRDVSTMTNHAYERVRAGERMPGLFAVGAVVPVGVAMQDVLMLAESSLKGEWEGQARYLPPR